MSWLRDLKSALPANKPGRNLGTGKAGERNSLFIASATVALHVAAVFATSVAAFADGLFEPKKLAARLENHRYPFLPKKAGTAWCVNQFASSMECGIRSGRSLEFGILAFATLCLVTFSGCGGVAGEHSVPVVQSSQADARLLFNCAASKCVSFPEMPHCSAVDNAVSCATRFAFWYEPWASNTLSQLGSPQVTIGVSPSVIPELHAANSRALAYVTYYQSSVPGTFITDISDLPSVGFVSNGDILMSLLDPGWYVLCSNSVELRRRVVAHIRSLTASGYDGLFVDNTILNPAAHASCNANHHHVISNERGDDSYLSLLAIARTELQKSNSQSMLITNPGDPAWADRLGTGQENLWNISDFVLWESYGYSALNGTAHDNWQSTIELSATYAADPLKASKIIALSYPKTRQEALFSFAIARMFGFRWTANLGEDGREGHFGLFTSSMPFSLGVPQGVLYSAQNGVLARRFTNGITYANTTESAQPIPIPEDGQLITDTGQQAITANVTVSLPSHAAAVLLLH